MISWGTDKITCAGLPIIISADQIAKYLVLSHWPEGGSQEIIPGFFFLVCLKNTGAAWGLFQGQTIGLSIFSILVLAFILIKFDSLAEKKTTRILSLTLIVGGISGNLIDRIFRGGVVDFILFYFHRFQWPAFNIADSAITIGVIIFLYSTITDSEKPHRCNDN